MASAEPAGQDLFESAADQQRFLAVARLAYFTPVREYPPLGDRKAAATLAASGLMITVMLFFVGTIIDLFQHPRPLVTAAVGVLVVAIAGLLIAAAGNAFHALFLPVPPPPPGLAFYPQIAARDREEYRQAVKGLTHAEALDHMLNYNYSLATQSTIKFGLIVRAVTCLEITFILWLALMGVIALGGSTEG